MTRGNDHTSDAVDATSTKSTIVELPINTSRTAATPPQPQSQSPQSPLLCLVCYTDLSSPSPSSGRGAVGHTACHHDEICGLCHWRLRQLHGDVKCPICKAVNEIVIVDYVVRPPPQQQQNQNGGAVTIQRPPQRQRKVFEDYPVWGEDLGADFVFDSGMFFPVAYYHAAVEPLSSYECHIKDCPGVDAAAAAVEPARHAGGHTRTGTTVASNAAAPTAAAAAAAAAANTNNSNPSLRALQDHLRVYHRLTLCQLCVDHQRDFVSRLPRYAPSGLQRHVTSPVQNQGHPACEFCRPRRFYDVTALHSHLNQDHYKCHVCDSAGTPNQFFNNYQSLQRHFDRQHFLCHDAQCLSARFVVFHSELDLRHHERQVHGGTSGANAKIQLEFRVARRNHNDAPDAPPPADADFNYAVDGTAFVPAALPSADDATLHPQHVARTHELREQAMLLRQNNDAADSYPSLQESVAAAAEQSPLPPSSSRLTVGWTADGALQRVGRQKPAGAVTEEDYPSLAAPEKKSAALSKLSVLLPKRPAVTATTNATGGWTAAGAAGNNFAAPRAAAPVYGFSATPTSFAAPARTNAPADLSASSFPSLGPPSAARPALYTAAQAYTKKKDSTAAAGAHLAADNFPALGGGVGGGRATAPASAPQKTPAAHLAADNFPALSGGTKSAVTLPSNKKAAGLNNSYAAADALSQRHARAKALGSAPPAQWSGSAPDELSAPKSAAAAAAVAVSVEDMKAALGAASFKQLKRLTREFAAHDLAADAYVDHAAALFPRGYADADFWRCVPALVSSCPPSAKDHKDAAHRYLDNLRRLRHGDSPAGDVFAPLPATTATTAAPSDWSTRSSNVTTARASRDTPARPAGRSVPPPVAHALRPFTSNAAYQSQSTAAAAWGTGTAAASAAVRGVKPPPAVARVSPGAAASTTTTSGVTTTPQTEQWQQPASVGKKKNKQRNELKALAFGN